MNLETDFIARTMLRDVGRNARALVIELEAVEDARSLEDARYNVAEAVVHGGAAEALAAVLYHARDDLEISAGWLQTVYNMASRARMKAATLATRAKLREIKGARDLQEALSTAKSLAETIERHRLSKGRAA